jgi:hypothetical protein
MVEEYQRVIGPVVESFENMREIALGNNRAFLDTLDAVAKNRQVLADMAPLQRAAAEFRRSMEAHANLLQQMTAPMLGVRAMWESQFGSGLSAYLGSRAEPVLAREWADLAGEYLKDFDPGQLSVRETGEVSLGPNKLTATEFKGAVQELAVEAQAATDAIDGIARVRRFLDRVPPWLRGLLVFIFIQHVLPVFGNMMTPVYESWWSQMAGRGVNAIRRELPRIAAQEYSAPVLRGHRFVRAEHLIVRSQPSRKGAPLFSLPAGKVVRLIDKKGDWAFIEFEDREADELRVGWVFKRYLGRFEN